MLKLHASTIRGHLARAGFTARREGLHSHSGFVVKGAEPVISVTWDGPTGADRLLVGYLRAYRDHLRAAGWTVQLSGRYVLVTGGAA